MFWVGVLLGRRYSATNKKCFAASISFSSILSPPFWLATLSQVRERNPFSTEKNNFNNEKCCWQDFSCEVVLEIADFSEEKDPHSITDGFGWMLLCLQISRLLNGIRCNQSKWGKIKMHTKLFIFLFINFKKLQKNYIFPETSKYVLLIRLIKSL